jgi:hypothetical protein
MFAGKPMSKYVCHAYGRRSQKSRGAEESGLATNCEAIWLVRGQVEARLRYREFSFEIGLVG